MSRIPCHWVSVEAEGIFERHGREDEERDHLKGEARQHGVDPSLLCGVGLCGRCNPTTCPLKNEGKEIATTENERVRSGAETTDGLAKHHNNAAEAEVDARRQKGRGDSETDNVNNEFVTSRIKGAFVEGNSRGVPYDFSHKAKKHSHPVTPCLVFDAEVDADK